jgi:hypothetical protein
MALCCWRLTCTVLDVRRFGAPSIHSFMGDHNSKRALTKQGGRRSEMSQFCRISTGGHGRKMSRKGGRRTLTLIGEGRPCCDESWGLLSKHGRLERSSNALLELLLQDYPSAILYRIHGLMLPRTTSLPAYPGRLCPWHQEDSSRCDLDSSEGPQALSFSTSCATKAYVW